MTDKELEKMGITRLNSISRRYIVKNYPNSEFDIPTSFEIKDIINIVYIIGFQQGNQVGRISKLKQIKDLLEIK